MIHFQKRFSHEGCGDVVLDEPKPLHLLLGKVDGAGVAAEGPLLEIVAGWCNPMAYPGGFIRLHTKVYFTREKELDPTRL